MKNPDLFLWANQADADKESLEVELFFFSKHYTVYSVPYAETIKPYIRAMFLYDIIAYASMGAATGMSVQEISKSTESKNVVDFVSLESVPNAQTVLDQLQYDGGQILPYSEAEYDIKKLAGIVAKFTPKKGDPFYIVKALPQSDVMSGSTILSLSADKLTSSLVQATVRINTSNQTLVIGDTAFVFDTPKFSRLFKYDPRKEAVLDNKLALIEKHFKISMPEGVTLREIAKLNASIAQRLMRSDPESVSQEQIIDQADRFQLALMTDDAGAIIIMDARDAAMFANLLNDDYVDSDMTGVHYLAVKKKSVDSTEEQQINMGV